MLGAERSFRCAIEQTIAELEEAIKHFEENYPNRNKAKEWEKNMYEENKKKLVFSKGRLKDNEQAIKDISEEIQKRLDK